MTSDYLINGEFKYICDNYQFSHNELKKYCDMEIKLMIFYLEKKRSEGDDRDKNIIFIEWIKTYSEFFRIMYFMLKNEISGAL